MRVNGAGYAPENCYDDPANCDAYDTAYAGYTNTMPPLPPPDFGTNGTSMNSTMARRSMNGQTQLRGNTNTLGNLPLPPYPEPPQPPLPPPRSANDSANISSSSNNDSNISAEISEAECDREHLVNRNYGGKRTYSLVFRCFLLSCASLSTRRQVETSFMSSFCQMP